MDLSLLKSDGRPFGAFDVLRSDGTPLGLPEGESRDAGPGPTWGGGAGGLSSFLPAPVLSGVAVTPETALSFVAVFAALNVISSDAASLPRRVIRRLKNGGRAHVPSDPRDDLIGCEPNEETTAIRFFQALFGHALSWGNGYAEIVRDDNGMPVALHLLSPKPNDTRADRTRSGQLVYLADGGRKGLSPEDVIHLAGLGFDGLTGYSPIAIARQAVGLGLAAEQFGASLFGNGATPKGVLSYPGKLSPEAIRNIREGWESVHQGTTNANRTAVLENGLTWTATSIPPEDAQFLRTREFQVIEIARLYRLPPHKLGDYTHSHLANIEEANLDYLNTTLGPWLEQLEQELDRKLFTARERSFGLHAAHDTSALLRGNAAARTTIYSKMAEHGALSPDEWREREGVNPIADGAGKIYYRPLNMVQFYPAPAAPEPGAATPAPGADPAAAAAAEDTAEDPEAAGDTVGDSGDDES